jgi:hypothetical protein
MLLYDVFLSSIWRAAEVLSDFRLPLLPLTSVVELQKTKQR